MENESYSQLEVAPSERISHPPPQSLQPDRGGRFQEATTDKQALIFDPSPEKQALIFNHGSSDPIALPAKEPESTAYRTELPTWRDRTESIRGWKRNRKRWMIAGIVALVAIAALAGGLGGGLTSKHSKSKPSATSTPSPTMSGTAAALESYAFPTAVSWGYPHLEVFALNSSIFPEWKYRTSSGQSSGTTGWQPATDGTGAFESIGGQTSPHELAVAALARNGTNVNVFVSGEALNLDTKHHDTSMVWGPSDILWTNLAGILTSPPTAASWGADRMDVFVINTGDSLSQLVWTSDDGWSDWVFGVSGPVYFNSYAPTVVSWAENRYDIFLVGGPDQALYHRYWDGSNWEPSTTDYENLGGFCTSRPVAASRKAGSLDILVRGGDAGLWHMSFSQDQPTPEQWSNWTQISGNQTVQAEPEAVRWDANNLHVFAWGSDGTLLHKTFHAGNSSWTPEIGFDVLGQDLSGPPKAVNDGQSIHVFAYLKDGQLGHKTWDAASTQWSPQGSFELLGAV
ncbi:uncharacterized protein Z520_05442 [Fonsecaea multimorphosa CBS 102226]|uniref:PLL-like beta propeller domain-containing protein n=1 Tax=Fonsecaea multimorphosa CBS 102226 TaxID=1442371 RepID=A0A0D2IPX5_9EURO|nr:uncharacterized protein Z520_05442 [Fonsecaea multimorphosa CBS 102226]KIX98981.1 hypothetical protein Z520_05442 [Fonsecaea multimorphosa CBS 102226]OAL25252.1 hypothetical protein AYO22_05129 [Fonsecaea multimorphosa]